ncbi:hypothetical protein MIR68_000504 [Amoeboaphelidium protococcarum]|nr:hypothetical protein MIR68_000504 [Amoeboaphelidium protococcarum]
MDQVVNTPLWHYSRSHIFPVQQQAGKWAASTWNVYPQFSENPQEAPSASDDTRLYNSTLIAERLGRDVAFMQATTSTAAAADPIPNPDEVEGQTHRQNWGRARKPSDFAQAPRSVADQSNRPVHVSLEDGRADAEQEQQSMEEDQMEEDDSSSGEDTFQSSDDSSDLPQFDWRLQHEVEQQEAVQPEEESNPHSNLPTPATSHPAVEPSTQQSLAVDTEDKSDRESASREQQRVLRFKQRQADDAVVFIKHVNTESELTWGFGSLRRVDVGKFDYAPFFVLTTAIQHDVVDALDCCKNLGFSASSVAAAKSHVISELAVYIAALMYRVEVQGKFMVAAGRADPKELHEEIAKQNEQYTGKAKALLAQPGVILNRQILEMVLENSIFIPIRDHIGNLIFESEEDDEE